jgi:hypothetical protein
MVRIPQPEWNTAAQMRHFTVVRRLDGCAFPLGWEEAAKEENAKPVAKRNNGLVLSSQESERGLLNFLLARLQQVRAHLTHLLIAHRARFTPRCRFLGGKRRNSAVLCDGGATSHLRRLQPGTPHSSFGTYLEMTRQASLLQTSSACSTSPVSTVALMTGCCEARGCRSTRTCWWVTTSVASTSMCSFIVLRHARWRTGREWAACAATRCPTSPPVTTSSVSD